MADFTKVGRNSLIFDSFCVKQSHAGRHFFGTENVIWAGFGPIGNTEKKSLGRLWATFQDGFFMFSGEFFYFFENVVASALKSCIITIWEIFKFCLPLKTWKTRYQIGLNSQSIVYWPIGDTSLRDFYIMTLVWSACQTNWKCWKLWYLQAGEDIIISVHIQTLKNFMKKPKALFIFKWFYFSCCNFIQ